MKKKLINQLKENALMQAALKGHRLGSRWPQLYALADQPVRDVGDAVQNHCAHCLAEVVIKTNADCTSGTLGGLALESACPGPRRARKPVDPLARDSSRQLVLRLPSPLHEALLRTALEDLLTRLDFQVRLAASPLGPGPGGPAKLQEARERYGAVKDLLDALDQSARRDAT